LHSGCQNLDSCFADISGLSSVSIASGTSGTNYSFLQNLNSIIRLDMKESVHLSLPFLNCAKILELSFPYTKEVDFTLFKRIIRLRLSFPDSSIEIDNLSIESPSLKELNLSSFTNPSIAKKLNCPKLHRLNYDFSYRLSGNTEDRIQFFHKFIDVPSVIDIKLNGFPLTVEETQRLCWKCGSLSISDTRITPFSYNQKPKIKFGNQLKELSLTCNYYGDEIFDFNSFQQSSLLRSFEFTPGEETIFPLAVYPKLLSIAKNLQYLYIECIDTRDQGRSIDLALFQDIPSISLLSSKRLKNFHCLGKKQRYLDLSACPDLTNEDLKHFSSIQELRISQCPRISSISILKDNYILEAIDLSLSSPVEIHLRNALSVNLYADKLFKVFRVYGKIEKLKVCQKQGIDIAEGGFVHQLVKV
jgi:hypothetical protein